MCSIVARARMFCAGIVQRRLSMGLNQKLGLAPRKLYSEEKKPPGVFLWGGGLGKLQGGLKEEEYFISLTQTLVGKMRVKKEPGDYLPNWDEFQKTLDHASLGSTSSLNKHKNVLEEAFFLDKTADDIKVLHDRAPEELKSRHTATELELESDPQNTK
ncbi:uncharacterized protein LOC6615694 [Drosophila sechellia]|uniref:GD11754 n=2 Tax=melanogaster subgroup TaxID=32351 RepID=B4QIM4_DROSI|nr:uncharacterized protein LOC6615694 [Drosophila sechellia]XP_002082767.1 uncharacterized protein LOC6735857 [Drosophila simulans]EDX08352.1 GD11754 [Drosophila simulans]KMY96011.1 uncharacterized protein Dsimw501_GD11754 [Drosophila simulans]